MMTVSSVLTIIFTAAGFAFLAISAFGVIRFPDFFTRLHASGVGETLGAALAVIGMMIMTGFSLLTLKLLTVLVLLMLTNPLGTNLIMMEGIHAGDYQGYNEKKRVAAGEKEEE